MTEDEELAIEARRIESDAMYTAQANFADAASFRRLKLWLGLPAAVLSGLAGTAVLTSWSDTLAGLFALAAFVLVRLTSSSAQSAALLNTNGEGVEYRALQHDARRLRELSVYSQDVATRRDALAELIRRQTDLNRLNRSSERGFRAGKHKIARGDVLQPGDEDLV